MDVDPSPLLLLTSPALESAWVAQSSPCCAAAVIAGALNALVPAVEQRWTCEKALGYLAIVMRRRLERQARRVQRSRATGFGFRSVGLNLSALETSIRETLSSQHGLQMGGQKKLSKRILQLAVNEHLSALYADGTGWVGRSEDISNTEAEAAEEVSADRTSVAFDVVIDRSRANKTQQARFQDELCEYFRLVDGLARLERRDNPSTSSCGNDTVLEAVRLINGSAAERQQLGLPSAGNSGGALQARLLAGVIWGRPHAKVNPSVAFIISRDDTAERRLEGWRELCAAFSKDTTALIYHLRNHYALIFALRERAGEVSSSDRPSDDTKEDKDRFPTVETPIREILTARKGQRPSTWIAWEEVHETLCSWRGYAILEVSSV